MQNASSKNLISFCLAAVSLFVWKDEEKSRSLRFLVSLIPSLSQPGKFPDWKMHGCACKQYIFQSCNTSTFNAMHFLWKSFHMRVWKRKQKGLRVKDFALLLFVLSGIMAMKGLILFASMLREQIWNNVDCYCPKTRLINNKWLQRTLTLMGLEKMCANFQAKSPPTPFHINYI